MLNDHPIEMGLKGRETQALCIDSSCRRQLALSFRPPPFQKHKATSTFDHLIKAIATFERTLISGHSPFDEYVFNGKHNALTPEAKRGMALFYSERLGCSTCHSGFNFSGAWRDAQGTNRRAHLRQQRHRHRSRSRANTAQRRADRALHA